ncbi:MAG TPA: MFS transporter [Atopostipes sp.]|nr:MFS transporter [Atopostipes sp.]
MNKNKPWIILLLTSLMVGGSMGLVMNLSGIYYTPMANDLGVLLGSVSLHGTFLSFSLAFASLTIPKVFEKLGLKKMLLIGTVLSVVGTFLMSFAFNVYITYIAGIIRGAGIAYISYVPMSMILNQWFEEKNGLAIGLASGFSGVSGAIAAPLFTLLIESNGWRFAFMINSLVILLSVLPILLFPFEINPADEGSQPYGYNETGRKKVIHRSEMKEVSPTNFIFIALMVIAFLNTLLVMMNAHFPGYGSSLGFTPEVGSLMLSAVMIGNLVWKGLFGALSDWIGPTKTSLFVMIVSALSIFMIISWTAPLPLLLGSFLFGATFSIGGVAMPILSNKFFGPIAGTKVYAVVNFLASAGGAVGVSLVGFIYDLTGTYVMAFSLGLFINLINFVLLLFAKRRFDRENIA